MEGVCHNACHRVNFRSNDLTEDLQEKYFFELCFFIILPLKVFVANLALYSYMRDMGEGKRKMDLNRSSEGPRAFFPTVKTERIHDKLKWGWGGAGL